MMRLLALSMMFLVAFSACGRDSGHAEQSAGALAAAMHSGGEETVSFTTSDGIVIKGSFYSAGSAAAPAVLCLHQWREDRSTFRSLATALVGKGYHVLAIDMRGYGESTKTRDGKTVRPDRQAGKDIEAAMAFLRGKSAVDGSRIGIIGASYGSSNAVIYAAAHGDVRTLVLLSPGLNYFHVLPTEDAVKQYGSRPMLAVASSEDVRSVEAVNAYKELGASVKTIVYDNAGHGTEILASKTEATLAVIDFLRSSL